ncbi:PACRG-like protein [Rhopilema esculentum]|uniref:PACRG-like protein n=1 Tax=Rhopilema esculentum TaxID=499914 RepID=UPI0031D563FE|eukprot:gene11941-2513_t
MGSVRNRSAPAVPGHRQLPTRNSSPAVKSSYGNRPTKEVDARLSKTKTSAATSKPSAKLNAKTVNPFDDKTPKSAFETAYANGAVPCRLQHGSVRHKLQWSTQPDNLSFDPILVTLAEGLRETRHPYTFVACEGFREMLMVGDAEERTVPLLPKLIPPIRLALGSPDIEIFFKSLQALIQLSDVTGPELNPHLKSVLPQISRRILDRNHRDKVFSALQRLEYNGGKESTKIIKARIPTYTSMS